jgi:peroxiredoxin
MFRNIEALLCAALLVTSCTCLAGQYNRVLDIGDDAPAWQGLQGIDGKSHDFSGLADAKFIVVAFTCNSCPYAVDVEDRLKTLASKATNLGGVLVAINVNTIDEDALPAMREKAAAKGFDFAYLYDPTQEIANRFGAKTTPEFYVIGPDRKIAYMGSLDDSPDGTSVNKTFVESAVEAVLKNQMPEVTETVPIGCRIRFARKR